MGIATWDHYSHTLQTSESILHQQPIPPSRHHHPSIEATLHLYKLFMPPHFYHPTMVDHGNCVSVAYGLQPVSNDDSGCSSPLFITRADGGLAKV
mmetsp:Transcript_22968/g.46636  ORF Transcript_22968/g.46636 Transcript_22968/m.46636 type:complete len:95 (+) Transcript_22968:73-357(+)